MKKLILLTVLSLIAASVFAESVSEEWTLTIKPGDEYSYIKWYGPFPTKKKPLIAVWLEDEEGQILRTLYITNKAAENKWMGKATERPESLPVYLHRMALSDLMESTDAISAASRGKEPEPRSFSDDIPADTARIMAEVNISYDYNDSYTKEKTGVNGQPSLIYQAEWSADSQSIHLLPAGTGSVDGRDGDMKTDLSDLTSALGLLEDISLSRQD